MDILRLDARTRGAPTVDDKSPSTTVTTARVIGASEDRQGRGDDGGWRGADREPKKLTNKKKKESTDERRETGDATDGDGGRGQCSLEGREGWGRASVRNVLGAIERAKDVTLGRCV